MILQQADGDIDPPAFLRLDRDGLDRVAKTVGDYRGKETGDRIGGIFRKIQRENDAVFLGEWLKSFQNSLEFILQKAGAADDIDARSGLLHGPFQEVRHRSQSLLSGVEAGENVIDRLAFQGISGQFKRSQRPVEQRVEFVRKLLQGKG